MYINDRGPFGDDTGAVTTTITGTGPTTAPPSSGGTLAGVVQGITQGIASVFGAQPQPVVVAPASSGIDTTTLLILGGLGIGAFLILKKKS